MSEDTTSAAATAQESNERKNARRHNRHPHKKQLHETNASLNMAEIREIAELVDKHGFTDFEFENENIRVRLSKNPAPQFVQAAAAPANFAAASSAPVSESNSLPKIDTPHPGSKAESEAADDEGLYKITSPIVGTFYRSPSPDKDPYIQVGSKVSDNSVVCIVEAMKLMNEIQAETTGEVVKIYVENGQPVEYGQPLFGIRK